MGSSETMLLCGDAIEELPKLPTAQVDLVLSDIPYGISLDEWDVLHANTNSALGGKSPAQQAMGSGFKRRGKPINGWSQADLERPREYQAWVAKWAPQLLRVIKPGGSVMLFCGRRTMHRATVAMEDSGFLVRDVLAWVKGGAHHRAQSLSKLFRRRGLEKAAEEWEGWRLGNLAPLFEPIVWCFKPYRIGGTIADNVLDYGVGAMNCEATTTGKSPTNVLNFDFTDDEQRVHEAQKPLSLLRFLIDLTTREGQLVLDPFMGSGSTGLAARQLGRRFIGIEQSADHFCTATRRLDGATQDGLFAKSRVPQKQNESLFGVTATGQADAQ